MVRYSRRRRMANKSKRISFKNHRHIVRGMKGLTSIPVRFRGRRINYAK